MRGRIFRYCLALILCVFTILGIMVNMFLNSYFTNNVSVKMEGAVSAVTSVLEEEESVSVSVLSGVIEYYSMASGSHIIVFDKKGNTVTASKRAVRNLYGKRLPDKLVTEILSGKKIKGVDRFSDIFGTTVIVFGEAVEYDDEIVGGVISVIPQPMLGELKWEILKHFLFGIGITLVIAFIMAYLLSLQVTKPIRKINDALKKLAAGEFKSDLNLGGDLKLLSDTFNEMAAAIKNSERAGKEFLANISHELRTPMTTVTGFLQGIEDGTIPKEKHGEYINLTIKEMKRLTRLVNELLEVARMELKTEEMTTEIFDINELLRVTLLKFENGITEKNLAVRVEFETVRLNVEANNDGITRVITNLIDNAVKFANEGGYIRLKTKSDGENAMVIVENSGSGIPKEDIELIFDRFHKSDKSRSMDKKGVGLGLYIVKNILKQHSRTITAESEEGKFARFTFSLKRAR